MLCLDQRFRPTNILKWLFFNLTFQRRSEVSSNMLIESPKIFSHAWWACMRWSRAKYQKFSFWNTQMIVVLADILKFLQEQLRSSVSWNWNNSKLGNRLQRLFLKKTIRLRSWKAISRIHKFLSCCRIIQEILSIRPKSDVHALRSVA